MEFQNKTRFPAHFYRTSLPDRRFAASVMVRITFDRAGRRLRPSEEQRWVTSRDGWQSPRGPMEGDDVFYRGGCDLFLFGSARPGGGREATSVDVELRIDKFQRKVRVTGERHWERVAGDLVPSPPTPFREIPLTLAHAFGGTGTWDGLRVPFADNPHGQGYYVDERSAEGGLLPNIEDPGALVARWTDRPDPVGLGFCPMAFGPRVQRGGTFDEHGLLERVHPELFNAAFPGMIAPGIQPGQRIRVEGVREDGPLELEVPRVPLVARLRFGDAAHEEPLEIDQIGIEVDDDRVFVSHRYAFRYSITPGKARACTVYERGHAR